MKKSTTHGDAQELDSRAKAHNDNRGPLKMVLNRFGGPSYALKFLVPASFHFFDLPLLHPFGQHSMHRSC